MRILCCCNSIQRLITDAADIFDYVIVDNEGTQNKRATYAAAVSDMILVPMQYSVLDLKGALSVLDDIEAAENSHSELFCKAVIPTRIKPTIVSQTQKQIETTLHNMQIPVLPVGVIKKDVYRVMFTHGCLLQDVPKFANTHNIDTAINNANAIWGAIANVYKMFLKGPINEQ